jgi:Arc/MetJ family transcription regulator
MTKTVDIELDEEVLNEAMRRAGTSEPRKALIEAVKEYTRPQSQKDIIKFLGKSDGFFTAEELEKLRAMD